MRPVVALVAAVLALVAAPAAGAVDDPGRPQQWALDRIGADAAWTAGRGNGVVVAVVDSGVDLRHEDLAGRLVPGWDFVDDDDEPQDDDGHGTHVAGIVAAAAGNGRGVAGVAPDARIMPVRVLARDRTGGASGTLDDVLAGIRWAVDHGAQVINLSLGEQTRALLGPSFGAAVREAWDAGAIPVVAAGNQYIAGSGFSDEPAMVVAATTRADSKPTYSSQVGQARWGMAAPGGETPTLGAEGAILSTYWQSGQRNQYAYLAGTSMAAPHVAGAAAVLRGLGLSPAETVQRLLETARDVGPSGPDTTFGAGRLDLAAATAGLGPTARPGTPTGGGAVTAATPPATTRTRDRAQPAPTIAGGGSATTIPAVPVPIGEAPGEGSLRPPGDSVALPADQPGDAGTGGSDRRPAAVAAAVAAAAAGGGGWWVRRRGAA